MEVILNLSARNIVSRFVFPSVLMLLLSMFVILSTGCSSSGGGDEYVEPREPSGIEGTGGTSEDGGIGGTGGIEEEGGVAGTGGPPPEDGGIGGSGGPDPDFEGQALLGPIVLANLKFYDSENLKTPVCETTTKDSDDLEVAGTFDLPENCIELDTLYLLVVSGGLDIDADDNGVIDNQPTFVDGVVRALVSGDQLLQGKIKVSPLTEIIMSALQYSLNDGDSMESILQAMNWLAPLMLKEDVDGDEDIDAEDLIRWNPMNRDQLVMSEGKIKKFIEDIHAGLNTTFKWIFPYKGLVDHLDTLAPAVDVDIKDNIAYVGTANALLLIDVANPRSTKIIGVFPTAIIREVVIGKDVAFVALENLGLQVVDIENPKSPELIEYYPDIAAFDMQIQDSNLFYLTGDIKSTETEFRNAANTFTQFYSASLNIVTADKYFDSISSLNLIDNTSEKVFRLSLATDVGKAYVRVKYGDLVLEKADVFSIDTTDITQPIIANVSNINNLIEDQVSHGFFQDDDSFGSHRIDSYYDRLFIPIENSWPVQIAVFNYSEIGEPERLLNLETDCDQNIAHLYFDENYIVAKCFNGFNFWDSKTLQFLGTSSPLGFNNIDKYLPRGEVYSPVTLLLADLSISEKIAYISDRWLANFWTNISRILWGKANYRTRENIGSNHVDNIVFQESLAYIASGIYGLQIVDFGHIQSVNAVPSVSGIATLSDVKVEKEISNRQHDKTDSFEYYREVLAVEEGKIAGATIEVINLSDSESVACRFEMVEASTTILIPKGCIEPAQLYLIKVIGGVDIRDALPISGTLHGVFTSDQLLSSDWQVTSYSSYLYERVKGRLYSGITPIVLLAEIDFERRLIDREVKQNLSELSAEIKSGGDEIEEIVNAYVGFDLNHVGFAEGVRSSVVANDLLIVALEGGIAILDVNSLQQLAKITTPYNPHEMIVNENTLTLISRTAASAIITVDLNDLDSLDIRETTKTRKISDLSIVGGKVYAHGRRDIVELSIDAGGYPALNSLLNVNEGALENVTVLYGQGERLYLVNEWLEPNVESNDYLLWSYSIRAAENANQFLGSLFYDHSLFTKNIDINELVIQSAQETFDREFKDSFRTITDYVNVDWDWSEIDKEDFSYLGADILTPEKVYSASDILWSTVFDQIDRDQAFSKFNIPFYLSTYSAGFEDYFANALHDVIEVYTLDEEGLFVRTVELPIEQGDHITNIFVEDNLLLVSTQAQPVKYGAYGVQLKLYEVDGENVTYLKSYNESEAGKILTNKTKYSDSYAYTLSGNYTRTFLFNSSISRFYNKLRIFDLLSEDEVELNSYALPDISGSSTLNIHNGKAYISAGEDGLIVIDLGEVTTP